jgi:hypothetical protein
MARTVLFSRDDVAGVINGNFEAAWETVRPVPIVRIDFGDGNVATRTLHGNIASHVCTADGQVVDILPGIYTPAIYAAALQQLGQLTAAVSQPAAERQTRLRDYHQQRDQFLRNTPERISYPRATAARPPAAANQTTRREDVGKHRMERPVEEIIVQAPRSGTETDAGRRAPLPANGNLAEWPALAADTWHNETQRRRRIHEHLATAGPLRPEQIKRWLYKEVLGADLDDPFLGLGDALFGDAVFREEVA